LGSGKFTRPRRAAMRLAAGNVRQRIAAVTTHKSGFVMKLPFILAALLCSSANPARMAQTLQFSGSDHTESTLYCKVLYYCTRP
jgi:hypothetical protein